MPSNVPHSVSPSASVPKVTAPSPAPPAPAATGAKKTNQANEFMQLLVAQMTHQSPLNPTSSDQFMQQMAQMQMVTELHEMSGNMQDWASSQALSGASSLIGHSVKLQAGNDIVSGIVQSVSSQQGKVMVVVDGHPYDMSAVQEIK